MDPKAPPQLDTFLPYMRDVIRCEQSLRELNLMWRTIEASAKMNYPHEAKSILPTMAASRAGFNRLEQEPVSSLVREKVSSVQQESRREADRCFHFVILARAVAAALQRTRRRAAGVRQPTSRRAGSHSLQSPRATE